MCANTIVQIGATRRARGTRAPRAGQESFCAQLWLRGGNFVCVCKFVGCGFWWREEKDKRVVADSSARLGAQLICSARACSTSPCGSNGPTLRARGVWRRACWKRADVLQLVYELTAEPLDDNDEQEQMCCACTLCGCVFVFCARSGPSELVSLARLVVLASAALHSASESTSRSVRMSNLPDARARDQTLPVGRIEAATWHRFASPSCNLIESLSLSANTMQVFGEKH